MNKSKLARKAINVILKSFQVYVTSMSIIYLSIKSRIAFLLIESVKIFGKYFAYTDVFLEKKMAMLSKITNLSKNAIKLQKG